MWQRREKSTQAESRGKRGGGRKAPEKEGEGKRMKSERADAERLEFHTQ